jgi:hypothetical protein
MGLEELPGKVNYFIGNAAWQWRTDIPTYARVKYQAVYPGVDLVYYGNQRQLEYDVIVAPGADPAVIQLAFEGASKLEINDHGDLVLHTGDGEMRLQKPVIYQETHGVKQAIPGRYVLKGHHQVGFHVAKYNASKPLVIDPVLSYSTYLGGDDFDRGQGIAVDAAGNAYVTGTTTSTNFPTAGPLQAALNGLSDAFVTKLNATGSAVVYSTYLGGSGVDGALALAVDSAGNAYITGLTDSTDFPTRNPIQAATGGSFDAFVTKLNATGNALIYSTYLGGSDFEQGFAIALDSGNNAYVTGRTQSTNFPTALPVQATLGGSSDAFIAKLNAAGNTLVYSTYLGGADFDEGHGIAVDSAGNAYVTGTTQSTNFPTALPVQAAFGGASDAFVTKLNAAGNALVYSTYLGGASFDEGHGIAVDSAGNAYVAGATSSTNFPTANPFQASLAGGGDAFVSKLNAAGNALVYSTYLGGSARDDAYGITADSAGNVYVAGRTASSNFPMARPIQATFNGGRFDAFVTKLNALGNALVYSSYLGGSGSDTGLGITVDTSGNAYVTGGTDSTDFLTAGPVQASFQGGSENAFVAKIGEAVCPSGLGIRGSVDSFCEGTSQTINLILTGSDLTGATVRWSLSGPAPNPSLGTGATLATTLSGLAPGDYTITATVTQNDCPAASVSTSFSVKAKPTVTISGAPTGTVCLGSEIDLTATVTPIGKNVTYNWSRNGAPFSADEAIADTPGVGTHTYALTVTSDGCVSDPVQVTIIVDPMPTVTIAGAPAGDICLGSAINLTAQVAPAGGAITYNWTKNGVAFSSAAAITDTPGIDSNVYAVTVTRNGCVSESREAVVTVRANLSVTVTPAAGAICAGGSAVLTAAAAGGVGPYTFAWSPSAGLDTTTGAVVTARPSATTTYTVTATDRATGCSGTASITVTVSSSFAASIDGPTEVCQFASAALTATPVGGTPPYTFLWNTGDSTPFVSPNTVTAGTLNFSVTVTDRNGCTASASKPLLVKPKPVVSIGGAPAGAICAGARITLTANTAPSDGAVTYSWTKNGVAFSGAAALTDTPDVGSHVYAVTVTRNGCVSDTVPVTVNVFDFAVSVAPNPLVLARNQQGSYTVRLTLAPGSAAAPAIGLTAGGLPAGITGTFTSTSLTPTLAGASTHLVIAPTAPGTALPSGTFNLAVTGTAAQGCVRTGPAILAVVPAEMAGIMRTVRLLATDTSADPTDPLADESTSDSNDEILCSQLPNGFRVTFNNGGRRINSTEPGSFTYNVRIRNTASAASAVSLVLHLPPNHPSDAALRPAGSSAFTVAGTRPVKVHDGDPCALGSRDITPSGIVINTTQNGPRPQPLPGSPTLVSVTNSIVIPTLQIPAGGTIWVEVALRYALIGTTGWPENSRSTFVRNYQLNASATVGGQALTNRLVTDFTGSGRRVTGIGGNALDVNGGGEGGLRVVVDGRSASCAAPNATTQSASGFYFVPLPANTRSTVRLFNASCTQIGQRSFGPVAEDQFLEIDFLNLSPPEP